MKLFSFEIKLKKIVFVDAASKRCEDQLLLLS
jgi:hypothetical protein